MRWVAGLPMYNVSDPLRQQWRALLDDVIDEVSRGDSGLQVEPLDEPFGDLDALWARDDLLLSQTCGYPLMRVLPDAVQVVATPIFDVQGCEGPRYRSLIVVSADAYAHGATTLEACRGLRAAYNDIHSNSGMNAFRHAVAPYAHEGRFFGTTLCTGGHLRSLHALADGRADVAAIDCVTFAYAGEAIPDVLARVRVIGSTSPSPGLPFITSATTNESQLQALRDALDHAVKRDPVRARSLRLRGFARLEREAYEAIVDLEQSAIARGYPSLQ